MDKKNGLIGAVLLVAAFGLMFWQSKVTTERAEQSRALVSQEQEIKTYTETDKEPKLTGEGKRFTKISQPTDEENGLFRVVSEEKELAKEFPEVAEQVYSLENDFINVRFTTRGGGIKDIALKKYPEAQGDPDPYVFNKYSKKAALALAYLGSDGSLKDYAPQFELISQGNDKILFGAKTPEGIEIYRGYSITDNEDKNDPYIVSHETRFVNKSSDDIDLKSLFVAIGAYPPTEGDTFGEYLNFGYYNGHDAEFVKIGTFHDSKGFFGIGKKSAATEVYKSVRPVIWGSIKNQFFTSVLTPEIPANGIYVSTIDLGKDSYEEGLMGSLEFSIGQIESGKDRLIGMEYYVGPKEYTRLEAMGQKQDLIMQFGFFRYISQILLVMMKWVHSIVPNWGLTIIFVTVIIKLILWPLTAIQVRSASRMAKIQKPLQELKEKYKDNPQKANQEVMKIYKEHNVSMFGGCLPLLVQWPLLFVLFGALNNYAPFNTSRFLWLSNINSPDTYYIMPVLVFLSMFLQSKTSQLPGVEMDSNTKMMTYFLPVIFAVWAIKWSPSILIYWITFSLIAVGEQTIILRGIRVAMEQPKGQSKSRIVEEELPQRELPEQIGIHEQSQVTKEKKEKEVKPVKTKKNPRSKQEKK